MTSSSSSAAGGIVERPEKEIEEGGRGEVGSATAVGTEPETAVEEGTTHDRLVGTGRDKHIIEGTTHDRLLGTERETNT